tara:strand:- start:422 stop:2011 length:1590 start_codon:yes stop_codon:yes gene_type:complete
MSQYLSKKDLVREIVKCGKDPVYFIDNYCKISHPTRGQIPFKTWDFQQDLLYKFNDYRNNIILKSRQMGISTISAAYVSWMMLFHRDKNILVIATKFSTAANLVKKVKAMIKLLPPWFDQIASIEIDNRSSFVLNNGSEIKASSTSADAGRSEALSLLVIDEAAHIDGFEDLWTALQPTMAVGGRCIALSSPNGVGNWFHKTYVASQSGDNDFHPTVLHWTLHPERDQKWFEETTRNLSRRRVAQEYECNFNASGETVINPDNLNTMSKACSDPKHQTGFDRNFWIWEEYNPENKYLLVGDVSRGDGNDFSVFHIFNTDTMEQVAEYRGKPTTDLFSRILFDAGKEYGDAMLIVENNNIGFSVLEKLIDAGYPNLYYSTKGSHEYIEQYQAERISNSVPGFTTSQKTRPLIVAKLEEFIRNGLVTINSIRSYQELKTFVWRNGRPEAQRGYNDDLVISLAIACWVRDTVLQENTRDLQYKRAFLNSMIFTNTSINTTIPGMHGYKKEQKLDRIKESEENYKNFGWLIKG